MSTGFVPVERRVMTGSVVSAVAFALSILQTLVQVPLLLRFWSPQEYGMWIAVGAAASLVTALDLGHQNYLGNLFNRFWVEDQGRLKATVASGVLAACGIAVLELLAGICLLLFGRMEWLGGPVHPGAEGEAFRIAFLSYLVFWVANGSVGGVLTRLYQPAGQFVWAQILGIIYRLSGLLALIVAASLGASIAGAMLTQVAVLTACNVYTFWDLRRKFPKFYPWWRGGEILLAWKNFRASLVLTVNVVLEQLASNGLVLLVVGILAPVEVAVFTTMRTVANTALQGIAILLYPIVPDVVRYHFQREPEKLSAVFGAIWCLSCSLVCLGFSLGALVIEPLYSLWTHRSLPFDRELFSLIAVAVSIRQWTSPLQIYLNGINLLPPQTLAVAVRAGISLSIAAVFLKDGGIRVAGVSLLVGELLAAAVCLVASRKSLNRLGGRLRLMPAIFSLSQILAMSVGLFVFFESPRHAVLGCVLAGSAVLCLAWLQWGCLDREVKHRAFKLFAHLRIPKI